MATTVEATAASATATAVPVPQLSPCFVTVPSKASNMNGQIIKSPLANLQSLPKDQQQKLDYKLDEFPGARDVFTPYGSIRVYEWGPEDGPKVLMIHGISTSCQALGKIASALVHKGFRVMLFDLFGRGFSDTPSDLPHDARLYVSQCLLVLGSSPLAWTGAGAGLRIIGYSLGGGIAANFAGTFPHMVESLTLLAPAGFIERDSYGAVANFVLGSPVVPEYWVSKGVKKKLVEGLSAQKKESQISKISGEVLSKLHLKANDEKQKGKGGKGESRDREHSGKEVEEEESLLAELLGLQPGAIGLGEAEAPGPERPSTDRSLAARSHRYKEWMGNNHDGFVEAYKSSLRYAPLSDQHDAYARLGSGAVRTGFIFARNDDKVFEQDYHQVALPLVSANGKQEVFWKIIGGGHHFPMTHASEAVRAIFEFWHME